MMGTLAVAGSLAISPTIGAVLGAISPEIRGRAVSLNMLGSIGSFTPVTHDDKLAQAYASAARESQSRGFRFTPAGGSGRSLTILVRTPGGLPMLGTGGRERVLPNLGVAPVAYRLGVTTGLARFATGVKNDAVTPEPPIVEKAIVEPVPNYVLREKRDRFSTNLQVHDREAVLATPVEDAPQTLASEKSYAVDLSSSFSLTRNLNVQAGVRYKGPANRLAPPTLTDQKQDSQAVYVGTTFKF